MRSARHNPRISPWGEVEINRWNNQIGETRVNGPRCSVAPGQRREPSPAKSETPSTPQTDIHQYLPLVLRSLTSDTALEPPSAALPTVMPHGWRDQPGGGPQERPFSWEMAPEAAAQNAAGRCEGRQEPAGCGQAFPLQARAGRRETPVPTRGGADPAMSTPAPAPLRVPHRPGAARAPPPSGDPTCWARPRLWAPPALPGAMGAGGLWVRAAHTTLSGALALGLFLHRTGEARPPRPSPPSDPARGWAGGPPLRRGGSGLGSGCTGRLRPGGAGGKHGRSPAPGGALRAMGRSGAPSVSRCSPSHPTALSPPGLLPVPLPPGVGALG